MRRQVFKQKGARVLPKRLITHFLPPFSIQLLNTPTKVTPPTAHMHSATEHAYQSASPHISFQQRLLNTHFRPNMSPVFLIMAHAC